MLADILNPKRAILCHAEVAELNGSASINSIIGEATVSQSQATQRIAELLALEASRGFVYYGEKQWLVDRVEKAHELSYEDWVFRVFEGASSTKSDPSSQYLKKLFDERVFFPYAERNRLRLQEPFELLFMVDREVEKPEPSWFVTAFHRLFYFYNYIEQALEAGLTERIDDWYSQSLAHAPDKHESKYLIVVEGLSFDVSEDLEHWDITFGTGYANSCMHSGFQGDKALGMTHGISYRRECRMEGK